MTRGLLIALLTLLTATAPATAPATAHADEKKETDPQEKPRKETPQTPKPVPKPAPKPSSPGWGAAGMRAPLFLWSAGASASVVASDQFAGRDESGWLLSVAPRLVVERPPARFSAWLHWEPSFVMREAGAFAGADNDFDGEADGDSSFVNQGAIGIRAGAESGPRVTIEARSAHSTETVFADQRGLSDHVETGGRATLALVSPERAHVAASAGMSEVVFSRDRANPLHAANHRRYDGTFDADTRVLLRTSVGIRGLASRAEYPDPPEEAPHSDAGLPPQEAPRTVDTMGALLTVGAQITPAVRFDVEAGAAQRREEGFTLELVSPDGAAQQYVPYDESTTYTPLHARLTVDVKRRARVELRGGSTVQDSLWRGNRWVRVHTGELRAGTPVISSLDLGAHAGVALASYPVKEYPDQDSTGQATGPLAQRVDTTFTAGTSLSYHPQGRVRFTLAYDRIQRDAGDFEQYEWEENRFSFSAFLAF